MDIAQSLTDLGAGDVVVTLIVSMLPIIELRGAIPIGAALGLPVWQAALISIVGNILPAPFIIAFVRVVMDWLRTKSRRMQKFVAWLEAKGTGKKAERVRQYEFWGLVLFVAIPLPGTGAWTGALVAALLDVRMKRALPAIVLGVLIAAVIISLATAGVVNLLV
ncbi:MAG: small multi-drug export protein [Oscillospiraceae bacterium]|nr:small multi-drug export protein [Oscillospiraceae bacterium]